MYTKTKEYQFANEERKIELIKIDAYNLMIKYLVGKIDFGEIKNTITERSEFGFLNKVELTIYLKNRILYEAYQCSLGKSDDDRNQIKKRLFKFKEDL